MIIFWLLHKWTDIGLHIKMVVSGGSLGFSLSNHILRESEEHQGMLNDMWVSAQRGGEKLILSAYLGPVVLGTLH